MCVCSSTSQVDPAHRLHSSRLTPFIQWRGSARPAMTQLHGRRIAGHSCMGQSRLQLATARCISQQGLMQFSSTTLSTPTAPATRPAPLQHSTARPATRPAHSLYKLYKLQAQHTPVVHMSHLYKPPDVSVRALGPEHILYMHEPQGWHRSFTGTRPRAGIPLQLYRSYGHNTTAPVPVTRPAHILLQPKVRTRPLF